MLAVIFTELFVNIFTSCVVGVLWKCPFDEFTDSVTDKHADFVYSVDWKVVGL